MRASGIFSQLWSSPWTGWVGVRYLKSKKNSRFLSFITLLSISGVALGVTSMIVVLSVMDGFESQLKHRLMGTDLHILITPTPMVAGFDQGFVPRQALDPSRVESGIADGGEIRGFAPVVTTEAILKSGRKVSGVEFKSFGSSQLAILRPMIAEGSLETPKGSAPGVVVGQELAYDLDLDVGDAITLISPTETEGPMSSVPRMESFKVQGIYRSGLPEQELRTVYASERAVDSFLRKADVVSQWELTVNHFDDAPRIASEIRAIAPDFRVRDWIELNQDLFWSLKLERIAMFVILAFIIVVASFNIVTTLTLMVLEKKKEISILRAMGARQGAVAAVFLAEGLLIGGLGIGGGMGVGFLLCVLLKKYDFVQLPDVFYDRTLPVTFDPRYYFGVGICAFVIVLVACLYPSRRAARLEPLEGIRFG